MRTSLLVTFLFAAALHAHVFSSYMLSSYAFGKRFDSEVTGDRVHNTPAWKLDADSPPLAVRKADQLAAEKFRHLIPNATDWERKRIALEDTGDGLHWIYVVEFSQTGQFTGVPPFLKIIVLMDGTVVEPRIREHK